MTTVPARLQPPNPPAPFVGRAALAERVGSAMERAPVTVLWGYSGAGKSALLAHVFASRFARERSRALVVDTRDLAGKDPVAAALDRLRALVAIDAEGDDDDAPNALLETLDTNGLWLIVENVERIAGDSSLAHVLTLVQRFARSAKIVIVCREDPRLPMLAAQTIAVGLMADDELRALVDAVRPGLSSRDATEIVALAQGSPWRLLQLSTGDADPSAGPEASLLALSPVAQSALRTLGLAPHAIPRAALQKAVRGVDDATLDLLSRRGYVELSTRSVRLHDAARPFVSAELAPDERALRQEKLLRALLACGDVDGARAALTLVSSSIDRSVVDELLAQFGDTLRAEGASALLLDVLLANNPLPVGARFAWACLLALDVGPPALAHVQKPALGDARALAFFDVIADARGGADLARDAIDVALDARLFTEDAALFGTLGRVLEAVRAATRALDGGRPLDARAALVAHETWSPSFEGRSPSFEGRSPTWEGRALMLVRARVALETGALEDARAALASVLSTRDTVARDRARVLLLAVRLAEGDLAHFTDDLADVALALDEHGAPTRTVVDVARIRAAYRALFAEHGALPRTALFAPEALDDAVRTLLDNDAAGAQREALKLRGGLRDLGRAMAALEAGTVALDAALAQNDVERASTLARQLAIEANGVGSSRFALEARLALACAQTSIDPAVLVDLSARAHTNPVVARRAAALLGEEAVLDPLDVLVVSALGPRANTAGRVIHAPGAAAWTLDAMDMRILLADGASVDLKSKRVLFDLLLALSRRGGEATKEQLLLDAWGVRDYHPLRHDNRLKAAVRKLRRLLESTLGDDPLETTDDGYRLRGQFRVVRDHAP